MARPVDGPAKRAAKGVVAITRAGDIGAEFIEVIVGVEGFIAEVLVEAAMELVGAVLGDEIKVGAGGLAVMPPGNWSREPSLL